MTTVEATLTRPGKMDREIVGKESVELRQYEEEDMAEFVAAREDIQGADPVEDEDEVFIYTDGELRFGGLLRTVEGGGEQHKLIIDSFEEYAIRARPTEGSERYDGANDVDIVEDAINGVPELEPGDLQTQNSSLSFIFSYTSPARQIREVQEATTGTVSYRADKTVDLLPAIRRDRTDITLSPGNQNVVDELTPERDGSDRITHLVVLGSGEGPAQKEVKIVPSSDPSDYTGEVRRYDSDFWDEGDRERWDTYSNKDAIEIDTLEEIGFKIIEESQDVSVEIDTKVQGVDVELGDQYHVLNQAENVDGDYVVSRHDRVANNEGIIHEITLTNDPQTVEKPEDKEIKDTSRYNLAFEGTSVMVGQSGGRQTVEPGVNTRYEMRVYYPDELEYEHRVVIHVFGFPFRYTDENGVTTTNDYPGNCDILINSQPLGVALGDGTTAFSEQVDISDELVPGAVNSIAVKSQSLGDLLCVVEADVYRQILGGG